MLSGLINTAEKTTLSVHEIKVDGGTQMRAGLHDETVAEYAQAFEDMRDWGGFPPVVVFYDGADYWLADGFHRIAAWRKCGNALLGMRLPAEIHSGTRRDAILYAAGANASHGLRRTNADKRRSVEVLLRDDEWSKWSDREIARHCQVSDVFVGRLRRELSANGLQIPTERTVQRNGTTYTQNTANIGARVQSAAAAPVEDDRLALTYRPDVRLSADRLQTVVRMWAGEYWTGAWPKNASHVDSEFWRQLTTWMNENIQAQWTESDLKQAIKTEYAWLHGANQTDVETRTIKAATWGDAPYAEVWEIERALARWQHNLDAAGLRNLARFRGGTYWFQCRAALGELHYRDRDLVQALNNLAAQMEGERREKTTAAAAPDEISQASAEPIVLPDERVGQAQRLMALYRQAIASEDEYGALTGCYSDWLATKRDLQRCIDRLQRMVDLLEGRPVEPLEGVVA